MSSHQFNKFAALLTFVKNRINFHWKVKKWWIISRKPTGSCLVGSVLKHDVCDRKSLVKQIFSTLANEMKYPEKKKYMSHFSYACKMRYPLNLVLENCEYLWFYLTFWIAILDCDLKLHKLLIHTLVMLQK